MHDAFFNSPARPAQNMQTGSWATLARHAGGLPSEDAPAKRAFEKWHGHTSAEESNRLRILCSGVVIEAESLKNAVL